MQNCRKHMNIQCILQNNCEIITVLDNALLLWVPPMSQLHGLWMASQSNRMTILKCHRMVITTYSLCQSVHCQMTENIHVLRRMQVASHSVVLMSLLRVSRPPNYVKNAWNEILWIMPNSLHKRSIEQMF